MFKATCFCRQCKEKFTFQIFEEGEAQKRAQRGQYGAKIVAVAI